MFNLTEIACLLVHLLRCIKIPIGQAIEPLIRRVDEPEFSAICVQLISSEVSRTRYFMLFYQGLEIGPLQTGLFGRSGYVPVISSQGI